MDGVSSAFKKVLESEEKNNRSYKYKPPDGGWGWVVVAAYAIQNIILLPVLINFGLMFRDVFTNLRMTTTDSSIIINVNSAAGLLLGLINGPLLKKFGFRKVACFGALLTFFGNSMTSFATNFYEFIIYYGIISSIGVMLVMASFSLALNTYFVERRGVATGLAMSFTGLGPIFMPLIISKLMTIYGGRGTALIMAGLTLHSFVGAMLLHPVKWYHKKVHEDTELQEISKKDDKETCQGENIVTKNETSKNFNEFSPRKLFEENCLRGPSGKPGSLHSLNISNNETNITPGSAMNFTKSASNREIHHASKEGNEKNKHKYDIYKVEDNGQLEKEAFLKNVDSTQYHERNKGKIETPEKARKGKNWKSHLVELFDLDLVQEPIFRNIWIGLSIAFTAEMNFTLMTPFILGEMGYDTRSTATSMSIMGTADILTRFISPFIGQRTKLPARFLYIFSLFILVIFRYGLTIVDSRTSAYFVFVGLGIGRGFRAIYHSLVIPNHVPIEKLPSAAGLQAVLNGICLMSFGPVLGYIKDKIGNYNSYIHVLNILTIVTIILWTTEFIIRTCQQKNKRTENV